ncbi:hypothetical protein LHP98_08835 [Rhodobacter sp. Har01]|uniref:hypothetical protein n=1 Tax=Rhodobacter sp. Har01 TaxID=2883999 RepID=UPI001D067085|nr:hypothetical protein [Rhodobacter sp. Har01]MCB6178233.1 hypothetical protein [Rhodobacter sp. Har01]
MRLVGRIEQIAVRAGAPDEAQAAASLAMFQRDVVAMPDAAALVSEGAAPLMPAPRPGSVQGLFSGCSIPWALGLDGMMQMQWAHRLLSFWPDCLFHDGTPPAGLAAFDRQARLDKGEPLSDGTRIDGALSSVFSSGCTPGSSGERGAFASTYTAFSSDGRRTQDASGGAFGNLMNGSGDLTGGYATSSESTTAGTYEVKDGLLIRTPNHGGTPQAELIFKVGDETMIGSLTLAGGTAR